MPVSATVLTDKIEKLEIIGKLYRLREQFKGEVFLVGGALRELALGKLPKDYDFAIERAEDLPVLETAFGAGSFLLGKKPIQTHRIMSRSTAADVTFLESSIENDLPRRDFTVNAMAYAINERRFLDPLHGLEDLEKKIIRYPRAESLKDDPLRMVKAMRHLATLSGFALDPKLKTAISANKNLINKTAPERIKYELDLILVSSKLHKGLKGMVETGLLFELFPEFIPMREMDEEKGFILETFGHTIAGFKFLARAKKLYRYSQKEIRQTGYAMLFHDLGKAYTFSYDEEKKRVHFFYHERRSKELARSIMERLRFGTAETKAVLDLIENHMRLFLISHKEATEKATRRLVYKMGELTPSLVFHTILDLYGTTNGLENESTEQVVGRCREVLDAFDEWKRAPLPKIITGHDLIALGFEEGPALGQVLLEIREKQIGGEIASKDDAFAYARGFLTLPQETL